MGMTRERLSTPTTEVFYDADCGMCSASVRWLRKHCPTSVVFTPGSALADTPLADLSRQALIVRQGDSMLHGADAVVELLRTAEQPWAMVSAPLRTSPGLWVSRRVYAFIAPRRAQISRLLRLPSSCDLPKH